MSRGVLACWLALCIFGCKSVDDSPFEGGSGAGLSSDYFEPQRVCYGAWQGLVEEWMAGGRGMRMTLEETKRSIAEDSSSRLSEIVRDVWSRQAGERTLSRIKTGEFLASAAAEVVPKGCASIIWLRPALVETPGVFSEASEISLMATAPVDVRGDSRAFGQWLSYQLLIPEGRANEEIVD